MPESAPLTQRLSLVTLGVADLPRAIAFYEGLGWRRHPSSVESEVAFYDVGGAVVALWGREKLARDSGVADPGGWGGVTLAHNVRERDEVDGILSAAERGGARIARAAAASEWGGYAGVFVDPDGHPWEVAVNPGWLLDDDGHVRLG